jgi:aspartate 1-decarboxylase
VTRRAAGRAVQAGNNVETTCLTNAEHFQGCIEDSQILRTFN